MDGWTRQMRWSKRNVLHFIHSSNDGVCSFHLSIHTCCLSIHPPDNIFTHSCCPPMSSLLHEESQLSRPNLSLSSIYPSKNATIYHANPSIRSFIQPSIHHAVTIHPVIYPFIQMSIHPVIYPDIYPSVIYPSIHHPVIIHPLICSSVLSFMHSLKSHLHRCSPNISFWLRISPDWPECPSIDPSKHRSNHPLLFSLSSVLLSKILTCVSFDQRCPSMLSMPFIPKYISSWLRILAIYPSVSSIHSSYLCPLSFLSMHHLIVHVICPRRQSIHPFGPFYPSRPSLPSLCGL